MNKERTALNIAVCMGFDAMRICLGMKPVNFTRHEVMRFFNAQARRKRLSETD